MARTNHNKYLYANSKPLTTPIVVAQIGKSPDVAQANGIAEKREQKIPTACPGTPFGQLLVLLCSEIAVRG